MQKKILFISPMFPENEDKNVVLPFITQFTQEFSNSPDVHVDVLTLMFPKSENYFFENIRVYPVGSGFKKSFRIIPYFIKAIFIGIQLCRKNKYEGILCFWYAQSALIGKALSKIFKIKQIVWMLGQDVKKENKYLKIIKINPENIIMASAQQRAIFYENHKIYVDKIANVSIDTKRFPELNTRKRNIDVLGVGNLGLLKNYALFVAIIAELKLQFPTIKAVICGGDSGEKENLIKQAEISGIAENIFFTNAVPHKKVLEYMNDATVFLHTSKFEGNPGVVQEALYSGCQVISTISMEDSETMDDFFHSTEKIELTEKIKYILKNPPPAKRVEKFKMKNTINVIREAFGSL